MTLIQIHHGYAAECRDLRLSVETGRDGWNGEVRDPRDGRTLYRTSRYSLTSAKAAIAEFALFVMGSSRNPDQLARELCWQEYW